MITLQMMKGTGSYNKMQRYIADVHKDLTPQQRAGKFTALLKKFVFNQNKRNPGEVKVLNLGYAFLWAGTPEGQDFWSKVDAKSSKPMVKQPKVKPQLPAKEQPPVKEQPKPAAPPLVWPKGATHYRHDLKRFFNEKGQWPVDMDLQFHDFTGKRTYENWAALPQTIKRPETPLPNGEQWKEGYTHWNPGIGNGGFQFNSKGLIHPRRGGFEIWNGRIVYEQWLADKGTITRYPDNQPLILDVPPQAPVRPVEEQRANPVGQPVQAENVAPKAPVEAPKPKKQVGWWR